VNIGLEMALLQLFETLDKQMERERERERKKKQQK